MNCTRAEKRLQQIENQDCKGVTIEFFKWEVKPVTRILIQ